MRVPPDTLGTVEEGRDVNRVQALTARSLLCAVAGVGCAADVEPEPTPPPPTVAPVAPWAWCPDPAALDGGGSGEGTLHITGSALYCGSFLHGRTLAEERAQQVQVLFLESSVRVPLDEGVHPAEWPLCLKLPEGQTGRQAAGEGTVSAQRFQTSDGERLLLSYQQPLVSDDGAPGVIEVELSGPLPQDGHVVPLDGAHHGLFDGLGVAVTVCSPHCDAPDDVRSLLSCRFDDLTTERHAIAFEGGEVELDLRIGDSVVGTQPARFLGGRGELDGVPFAQADYWSLAYNPTLHHFSRDFALLFDEPIGEACGMTARNVDPWADDPPAVVELVDCDLQVLEERAITGDSWGELGR